MKNASGIYVGRVTGIRNVSFEERLKAEGDSDVIQIPSTYKMRVYISQTLKGKTETIVEASSTLCKEHYDIREKVFVFSNSSSNYVFAISENDLKGNFKGIFRRLFRQRNKSFK